MAGASTPGPTDNLGPAIVIDDGTLHRTEMQTPGPIGLQAKGGAAKGRATVSADRIVEFARRRMGQVFGDGQCFDLVDQALRSAGAKTAADFGRVAPEADYVWGGAIGLSAVQAGDVIQFRGYRYDRTIASGGGTDTDFQERPHHSAIVESVEGQGTITVIEQNAPDGAPVGRCQLFFSSSHTTSGGRTTTIEVKGQFWIYRPQPR